ncbi:MAG: T9SS type A sorting domain-containing protein [Ferruginibacter sp.]
MKRIYLKYIAVLGLVCFSLIANAQLTGTKNIPGDYADLATAITDLNTQGVGAGGVTLNLLAGNPETSPAGGYSITATGTVANPINITGNGNTITAPTTHTVGALNDAIFKIIGADYVTIQGFTMLENAANTTTAAGTNNMTEWGVALLYATTTDGAQNCTIQNNTITLNKTYQNTFGIYSNSAHSATVVTTSASATTTAGGNSGLKIYSNIISNVNNGIAVVGPTAAADFNNGIDIGGNSSATANTISNYGTTGTFSGYIAVSGTLFGVLVRNSTTINVSYNNITSPGTNTLGTMRAIYVPAFSIAPTGTFTNTFNNNTISVSTGLVNGALQGIAVETTTGTATSTVSISNNNFTNLSYNVASPTGAVTIILDAMAHLNTSINGNTFTNLTVNTTGSITFISHSYSMPAAGTQTINNNSIVTAFNKTGAGGTVTLTTTAGSSPNGTTSSVTNNNFSNITVTGATAITGINNTDGSGTSPAKIATGNTFNNWTGGTSAILVINYGYIGATTSNISNNILTNIAGQGTITGIQIGSSFSGAITLNVSNNTINNFTSSGTGGSVTGITCSNTSTSININANGINTLSSTGASAVNGIVVSGATSTNVFKNKIYDLSGSNVSSTANGILVSAGSTVTVYNNLVGDLRTTAANAANPLIGLSITGGTTVNAYFNTVYLNGTSSGALFGSSAVSVSTTPTVTLRNNIFVNTSTVNGAAFTSAYRRSTATLTNYGSASNNNLFYSGTPSATNVIFYDGTNSDQTLAAYKIRVAARDASSITENPTFLSTSGASANFLHIDPTVPTQIESGAVAIGGITDDFDGDVRNVSTPDIGADEFAGIGVDITGPSISYTPLGNTLCTTNRTLTATITDASGVNVTAGTAPRIYYKKSTNANTLGGTNNNTTDGWKNVESTTGSSPFSFTIDYSLVFGGVAAGDSISYFIVAQDLAGTPNVSINSGSFAAAPSSVALTVAAFPVTGTVNGYNLLVGGLSTDVTIGASGTYPTLTGVGGLFAAINSGGLTANITARIIDASIAETGAIALNQVSYGCAGISTLTIKPDAGVTTTLTGSVASGALIKLNGADYVTIDGSNNGTNSKNLTITNTATTAPTVISLVSLGTGAGAINNTIKNCFLSTGVATTTGYGISVGGNTPGTSGADNDNTTLQNNTITIATIGIYANGTASVSSGGNDNLAIAGNSITTNTAIATIGIQVGNALNSSISQNTVSVETSVASQPVAISLETGFVSSSVTRNNITKALASNTGGYGGRGITIGTGTATSNLTVANNFISGVNGSNWSSFSNSSSIGIAIGIIGASATVTTTAGGINLYFNSVSMAGSMGAGSTTALTSALYVGSGASVLDIRNNIFSNTQTGTNATQKNYAIYSAAANTAFTTINYNDYYVLNTFNAASAILGNIGATDRTTLAAIITGFGQNANSVSGDPKFLSTSDLHISTVLATPVESAATPIGGITTDIDGDIRNVSTPDIGADEGTFIALVANDMQATAFISPVSGGAVLIGASFSPQASFTNNGTATQTNVTVRYRIVNAGLVEVYNNTQVIASIASGITTTVTFASTSLAIAGTYTIYAKAELVGDAVPSNDEITGTITVEAPLCGTYAVGASQPAGFQNLTQAIGKLNSLGVSCAVIFALQADYSSAGETFPLTVNAFAGASATNTFTLKPAAGVTSTISGAAANTQIIKVLGNYVTIDGSNNGSTSRDLTLSNTSITTPQVALIGSLGTTPITNVTLKNTIIINGVNTSTAIVISDGAAAGTAGYFNNITLQNNSIQKAYMGVYSIAVVSPGNGSGLLMTENLLNITGPNAIRYIGLYVQGVDGATVSKNMIANFDGTSNEDDKGIWLATGTTNSLVEKNQISNLNYLGASGYGAHGIFVSTGLTSANISVSNNMIANLSGDGWSYTSIPTDNTIGIALSGTQTGINVHYNSINLYGNTLNQTSAMSMGIYLGTGSVAEIQDNIIVNNLGLLSSTGYGSAGIYAATANTQFTVINYNDYYVAPTGTGVKFIGQIAATGQATLAGWQTATGQDANSVNIQPYFVSTTDLHLDPLNAGNLPLDNLGTPIAGITTDIDNQARSVTTPDMGADEFTYGVVVPVTVEFFRGAKQTAGNLLDWKVNCTSSSYATLTLERSADGRSFSEINSQQATSLRCQSPFNYLDAAPLPGVNYYRLKMTDADGKTTYSHLVVIINKEKGFEIVGLNPNPVYNAANLNLTTATAGKIEVLVTDINGRLMQRQSVQLQSGSNLVPLKVSLLVPGSYQVTVINADGEKTSIRFVKQ